MKSWPGAADKERWQGEVFTRIPAGANCSVHLPSFLDYMLARPGSYGRGEVHWHHYIGDHALILHRVTTKHTTVRKKTSVWRCLDEPAAFQDIVNCGFSEHDGLTRAAKKMLLDAGPE